MVPASHTVAQPRQRPTQGMARQTLYAILSAIEADLRHQIDLHLGDYAPNLLIPSDRLTKCIERWSSDSDHPPVIERTSDLIDYLDFSWNWEILQKNKKYLPEDVALCVKGSITQLDPLAAIRNRVCHSRPLEPQDFSTVLDSAQSLSQSHIDFWKQTGETLTRITESPQSVLGTVLPLLDEPSKTHHNLPHPDFDETGLIGRDKETQQIVAMCKDPRYRVITVAGHGGVGKTALALRAAYHLVDDESCPFEAIVWTTAKLASLNTLSIQELAGAVRDIAGIVCEIAEAFSAGSERDALEEVLEYLGAFKTLLIIDNLETLPTEDVLEFVRQLPLECTLLITSRIGLGQFETRYDLTGLSDTSCISLIRAFAKLRQVPFLTRSSNDDLRSIIEQLHNNPLAIKWFVNAVQAGARPEDVLAREKRTLLHFCLGNVYETLGAEAREVAELLAVAGRPLSLPAINHVMWGLDIDDLHTALLTLQASRFVSMKSTQQSGQYVSTYEIAPLAMDYITSTSFPEESRVERYMSSMRSLSLKHTEFSLQSSKDPYMVHSIKVRSREDTPIALLLNRALSACRGEDYGEATELLDQAKTLAPNYSEVHRVHAFVLAQQRRYSAAARLYDLAIQLDTTHAPTYCHYAGMLMRYMDDLQGALELMQRAEQLDTGAARLKIEVARVHLYLGHYEAALEKLDETDYMDLTQYQRIRLLDLKLQLRYKWAEHLLRVKDHVQALHHLNEMLQLYETIHLDLRDRRMLRHVEEALRIVEYLQTSHYTDAGDLILSKAIDVIGRGVPRQPEKRDTNWEEFCKSHEIGAEVQMWVKVPVKGGFTGKVCSKAGLVPAFMPASRAIAESGDPLVEELICNSVVRARILKIQEKRSHSVIVEYLSGCPVSPDLQSLHNRTLAGTVISTRNLHRALIRLPDGQLGHLPKLVGELALEGTLSFGDTCTCRIVEVDPVTRHIRVERVDEPE